MARQIVIHSQDTKLNLFEFFEVGGGKVSILELGLYLLELEDWGSGSASVGDVDSASVRDVDVSASSGIDGKILTSCFELSFGPPASDDLLLGFDLEKKEAIF